MGNEKSISKQLPIFTEFSDEERKIFSDVCTFPEFEKGQIVFKEGDEGNSLYIVNDGCVQINTIVAGEIEKTLITLRDGGIFGELSLITDNFRSATATALEKTTLISFDKDMFAKIQQDHPAIGQKILSFVTQIIAERLRNTTDLYKQAVEWGISISGILELNFHQLISEQINISLELNNGKSIVGTLLKADKGVVGYELLIRNANNEFVIIPYHAICNISFSSKAVKEA